MKCRKKSNLLVLCSLLGLACGGDEMAPIGFGQSAKGEVNGSEQAPAQQLRCCNLFAEIGPEGQRLSGAVPYATIEYVVTQQAYPNWIKLQIGQATQTGIFPVVVGGANAITPMIQGSGGVGRAELPNTNLLYGVTGTFGSSTEAALTARWTDAQVDSLEVQAKERATNLDTNMVLKSVFGLAECRPPGGWNEPLDAYWSAQHCHGWPAQYVGMDAQGICSHLHTTW